MRNNFQMEKEFPSLLVFEINFGCDTFLERPIFFFLSSSKKDIEAEMTKSAEEFKAQEYWNEMK